MMTRCVCKDLSFLGLMTYARQNGVTQIDQLSAETGCCTGCGTCRPYLEELLRSGKLRCGDQLIELPRIDAPLRRPPGRDA